MLVPMAFDNRPTLTLANFFKSCFDEAFPSLVKGVFDDV